MAFLGLIGILGVKGKEKIFKILNKPRITLFLGLILISLISFKWSPELKNSFNAVLELLEAFVIYVFFILLYDQKVIKLEKIINWWLVFVLINFVLEIWLLVNKESWSYVMSFLLGEETTKTYLLELLRERVVPLGSVYNIFLLGTIKIFEKNVKEKYFGWIVYSVGLISLMLSSYRSMVVVSFLGIGFIVWLYRNKFRWQVLKISLFSLGIILLTILGSKIIFNNSIGDRFLMKSVSDKSSIISRWEYITESWNIFLDEPWTGVSIGNFSYLSRPMKIYSAKGVELGELPGQTHCLLLSWLAETGIVGFVILVALIWNLVIFDLKNYFSKRYDWKLNIIMIVSYVYLLGSMVDAYPTYGFLTFWVIRGILEKAEYEKK